ncbi:MAG: peptide chain release factor 2, partial [bacterium]
LNKELLKTYLSGPYDKRNAVIQIYSGAGGQDSQDWATMLLRMYSRYASRHGYQAEILDQSFGEGGGPEGRIGTKQVSLEIKGRYAYGYLKKEKGVHRLVRISPFSSQKLRHTSFALVEVLPLLTREDTDIVISPDDLKFEAFRSSGPGGQNVNKRETAVRIIHIPTGITVTCQTERSQLDNRERAMKVIISKLELLREENHLKELKEIKGDVISASWGHQIRSYVLHPYKLVKDLRTDVESTNPDSVLDGELDNFINAEFKLQ